jgi:hypothetical protein
MENHKRTKKEKKLKFNFRWKACRKQAIIIK